jgi:hypothetical protein
MSSWVITVVCKGMSCSRVSERVAVTTTRSSWVLADASSDAAPDAASCATALAVQAAHAATKTALKTNLDGARWRKREVMSTVLESSSGRRQQGLAGQSRCLAL